MVAELILIPKNPKSPDSAKGCAQYVARTLTSAGMKVREQISLCTGKADFQKAIATALGRSNIVIALGGLDAEQGYLSKQVICKGLNLPLEQDASCLKAIQAFCESTGEFYLPEDEELARVPQGAVVFPGQHGKIPGMVISSAKQHIILMPDSQTEAAAMLPRYIIPYLSGGQSQNTLTRTVRTYGINAEQARASLCELLDTANPAVTVEKEGNEVLVRVSAHSASSAEASSLCTPVLQTIVERLGDAAYGLDVDSLQSAVVGKLQKKNLNLAVVETGSGGIVGRVLSETAGGSQLLAAAETADRDEALQQDYGVSPKVMKKYGSVSEQAVVAMADAVRKSSGGDLGLAVAAHTSEGQKSAKGPLGLVYIAVCDANNVLVKKLVVGSGTSRERDIVIDAALSRALNMVRLFVDYLPRAYSGSIPLADALSGKTVTDHADDDGQADGGKQGFLRRVAGNFIIRKADEPREKVRKFIFILAVLVFLGSAAYVGNYYYEGWAAARQAEKLASLFEFGDEEVEISEDFPDEFLGSFAALWSINPDVVGYLSVAGTPLQYPVVQSYDNDYYLRRDFYEKSNQYGIPFMDYRVEVARPSDNMVIYGHNMKDGQMFGELVKYRDLDYYKAHPVIDFSTLYSQDQYKIVSVFLTNAYEAQGTPLFDYHNFINAKDDADFMEFVQAVQVRSLIDTPVDVQPGDKLLTLSTCEYDFTEARLVVVARQVRRGEDPSVDVSQAKLNPNPLYPDIWYSLYGGTRPNVPNSTIVTEPSVNRSPSSSQPSASTPASTASPSSSSAAVTQETTSSESAPSSTSSEEPALDLPSAEESSQPSQQESSQESQSQTDTSREPTLFDNLPDDDEGGYMEIAARSAGIPAQGTSPLYASKVNISTVSTREPTLFDFLDDDPPDTQSSSGSSSGSSRVPGTLTVSYGGKTVTDDAHTIISRIVQAEVGSGFHEEAIKAQAVAAYTYILYYNGIGQTPSVVLAPEANVHNKVANAVSQVLGEAVYYDGNVALTSYYATSAGQTTSSQAVWGGALPYLVSVDSSVDKNAPNYKMQRRYSSDQVSAILEQKLGIETWGDPADWFEILSYSDGGYVEEMAICGITKSQNTGNTITGRMLRESVFGLRSAYFKVNYDADTDTFAFITYGYGHGVGMSQNGANLYAQQGWTYEQILAHYYPGTTLR